MWLSTLNSHHQLSCQSYSYHQFVHPVYLLWRKSYMWTSPFTPISNIFYPIPHIICPYIHPSSSFSQLLNLHLYPKRSQHPAVPADNHSSPTSMAGRSQVLPNLCPTQSAHDAWCGTFLLAISCAWLFEPAMCSLCLIFVNIISATCMEFSTSPYILQPAVIHLLVRLRWPVFSEITYKPHISTWFFPSIHKTQTKTTKSTSYRVSFQIPVTLLHPRSFASSPHHSLSLWNFKLSSRFFLSARFVRPLLLRLR